SGAAGGDDHAVDAGEQVIQAVQLGDGDLTVVDATTDRVRDGLGLFGDLLGHERRPAALLGRSGVPRHVEGLGVDGVAVEVGDGDLGGGDRHDLVLPDGQRLAG